MPRIKGIDIPNEKRIEISLTYIKGIGLSVSRDILKKCNVDCLHVVYPFFEPFCFVANFFFDH